MTTLQKLIQEFREKFPFLTDEATITARNVSDKAKAHVMSEAYDFTRKELLAWLESALSKAFTLGREEKTAEVEKNVGLLRQWLNEDRITDKEMVTNEELMTFFKHSPSKDEK